MLKLMSEKFLADTYALLEIIGGNPHYQPYLHTFLVTTEHNLMELYYALLRDYSKERAEYYLHFYSSIVEQISLTTIRNGMQFKLWYRKENLSYVDCIGYALALELGIKFLTGDQKFKDKVNVEFVK